MSRRDYLKYLGFQVAVAQIHLKELKQTTQPMSNKEPFRVRVTRVGDENGDYSYASGYDVVAPNYHDAEKEARKKFCEDFGAPFDKTVPYTFNKQQK